MIGYAQAKTKVLAAVLQKPAGISLDRGTQTVGRNAMNEQAYLPGTRVAVFDTRLYRNDRDTPDCIRPATILRWYGKRSRWGYTYPSLIDVRFDYDGRESAGHFANEIYITLLGEPES